MHFKTLVKVKSFTAEENPFTKADDYLISQSIASLKKQQPEDLASKVFQEHLLEKLGNEKTLFARTLGQKLAEIMEPYSSDPPEEFLEFYDMTDELQESFEGNSNFLKLADGRIVEIDAPWSWREYYSRFCIIDGKVYEKNAGQLKHPKRTKAAKRITALENYPVSKVYKSYDSYASKSCFEKDPSTGKYGYWHNPNAMWDFYNIGGRFDGTFIVKADCAEYIAQNERSSHSGDDKLKIPEGYVLCNAARKKDICWDTLRDCLRQMYVDSYYEYQQMFKEGVFKPFLSGIIKENGLFYYDGNPIYIKDESLEAFLARHAFAADEYPVVVSTIVDDEEWRENCEYEATDAWCKITKEYIDSCDDEDIFVIVDYHR